jgi:hypothetical protein
MRSDLPRGRWHDPIIGSPPEGEGDSDILYKTSLLRNTIIKIASFIIHEEAYTKFRPRFGRARSLMPTSLRETGSDGKEYFGVKFSVLTAEIRSFHHR